MILRSAEKSPFRETVTDWRRLESNAEVIKSAYGDENNFGEGPSRTIAL